MSNFTVGQKVKITYCNVREELAGVETEITADASLEYEAVDFADSYDQPGYRVAVDPCFRPIDAQLEAV